ncbi:Cytochrome P450 6B4 [Eufriesea mexicana]|uniref:cytochrome P450 6B4-like n=1 Tax=Eufriesea mexicana TaxID=516756 RepID=UPI00083C28C5|nr:PREDICTED: cytochrome P450 6B4-like [Eufriesea mexicana]XP_017757758.1 PREDICTED: cytochrome P450 6B4-like [Eufriesea mexicana]OAD56723.1 Cytochrome P450 6B4 [Eufriesea mexicana]
MEYLEIFCGIVALFLAIYYYFTIKFKFWESRGVIGPRPIFLFGNFLKVILARTTLPEYVKQIYEKYENEQMIGTYMLSAPVLILRDPEIIKDVLIRDFSKFGNRGINFSDKAEPLSTNILNLEPKRWRPLRGKLSPMFTSGKLKDMFDLILESGAQLEKYLNKIVAQKEPIDFHNVTAKFATDVIGSCAFGIETSALDDEESDFRKLGKTIVAVDLQNTIRLKVRTFLPKLYDLSGYIFPERRFTPYFTNLVADTMKYRKENKVYRPDFIHILMELKEHPDSIEEFKLTNEILAAQAFIFFVAGFETSSSTMSNALYELARNPQIQDKLREEIREHYAKHNGKLKYEHIKNMEYLDKVFKETLRMYPPAGTLPRLSMTNYTFKNTKISIPKDVSVWIPVFAIHRSPDIYPNPDVFNPENFSEAAIATRHPMFYLPFGGGPRKCIGERFGIYQTKIGLISILRNYKVDVCKKTMIPYEFDPNTFLLAAKGGIYLNVSKVD